MNKKTKNLIHQHLQNPQVTTQAEVMRRLKLTHRNDFYRLFYKVMKEEQLAANEE